MSGSPEEETKPKSKYKPQPPKTWTITPNDENDDNVYVLNEEEIKVFICERLEYSSWSLRGLLLHFHGMPGNETIYRWLRTDTDFRDNYARVRTSMADYIAEEILDIVDDGSNDYMEEMDRNGEPTGGWSFMGEHVQRSKLRVETRKWLMAKAMPKKYGEVIKVEVENTTYGDKTTEELKQLAADYVAHKQKKLGNGG